MNHQELLAVLAQSPSRCSDFVAWRAGWRSSDDPVRDALQGGLAAGNLALAFAAGYQAALRLLLPGRLAGDAFAALLLSEGRRQRPEELATRLQATADGFALAGEKSWVTGGEHAEVLLVVARSDERGAADGAGAAARVPATLVMLPRTTPGVMLEARTDVPVLHELPHARARFMDVPVTAAQVLPGDGWRDYGKPFRSCEDICVSLAFATYLFAQGRAEGWPATLLASLAGCVLRLADLARLPPGDAPTHLLLAAAEQELASAALQVDACLAGSDTPFARDWRANRAFLLLAAPARAKRLHNAIATLFPGRPDSA